MSVRTAAARVTGIGIVAPTGIGVADYWAATVAGRSALRRITRFDPADYPARLAGEIDGFAAADHLPSRLLPQTDQMTRLALVAAAEAFADAGLDPATLGEYDVGVVTSSAAGGFEFGQRELEKLWSRGGEYVSAYQSFAWFYAVNTGQVSIRHGLRGPGGVLVAEQAGGLDAVAQARRHVRRGVPYVVTGGVDSALCPWGWVAQVAGGRLTRRDDPARAYRPFDPLADGYVAGEGGAILLVEAPGARDVRGYATIAGYAATFDPRPGSGREPALRRAVEGALADAGVDASDVDVVFADAAGVPDLDRVEAQALADVFGAGGVPVTAPKAGTGRLYAGGGALDLATAVLAVHHQIIPPTPGARAAAANAGVDLVRTARPARLRTALVLARGYGGFNSAIVVRREPDSGRDGQP